MFEPNCLFGVDFCGRKVLASAFQVGLFAVLADDMRAPISIGRMSRGWNVSHIPSGFWVCDARDFTGALVLADDFSRFSANPDVSDGKALREGLGPDVTAWMLAMRERASPVPFREWRKGRVS